MTLRTALSATRFVWSRRVMTPYLESLKAHVLAFVSAYNFAKHLKAIRWKTPFEAVCHASMTTPDVFKPNPRHLIPGPNTPKGKQCRR